MHPLRFNARASFTFWSAESGLFKGQSHIRGHRTQLEDERLREGVVSRRLLQTRSAWKLKVHIAAQCGFCWMCVCRAIMLRLSAFTDWRRWYVGFIGLLSLSTSFKLGGDMIYIYIYFFFTKSMSSILQLVWSPWRVIRNLCSWRTQVGRTGRRVWNGSVWRCVVLRQKDERRSFKDGSWRVPVQPTKCLWNRRLKKFKGHSMQLNILILQFNLCFFSSMHWLQQGHAYEHFSSGIFLKERQKNLQKYETHDHWPMMLLWANLVEKNSHCNK